MSKAHFTTVYLFPGNRPAEVQRIKAWSGPVPKTAKKASASGPKLATYKRRKSA